MDFPASQISIIGFLMEHQIKNERGELINFHDRPFLYDPMRDWSRFQCYKKAAQGIGMSVTMFLKSVYAAKYMGLTTIHTFPTDSDAAEFVTTKANKMLQSNEVFKGIQSDNIERKQIGDRFLHYKGTISKSGALSTTADIIIGDEKDRSDQQKLKDFESRTIASKFKGRWTVSNPSVDGNGVDADWAESDKKEWFVTCKNKHAHPMVWPESVDLLRQVYVCSECKVELSDEDRRHGDWVATGPKDAKWSGYHMTLLFCPTIPASYVIEQWGEGKNPEYFNNFILGEPYSPGDTKIDRHVILDNWTPKTLVTGNYFLGVDVGNIRHYVLGSEKGITEIGTFTGQAKLDQLLERYKPTAVMDAMPENTMAHHYKDTYPNFYICHLGRDKETGSVIKYGEDDKRGIIFADKHRAIDRLVDELLEGKIQFAVPSDQAFRTFLQQCADVRRVKEMNALGVEHYVWSSLTGDDHGLFALLYWFMAKQSVQSGAAAVIGSKPPPPSIVRTMSGFQNNLKEDLENREYGSGY